MCDLFSVFTCWCVTAVSVFTRWCVTDWCVHSLVCYLFFLCKWTERAVINDGWSIIEGTVSASSHSKVKGHTNISDMDPWTPPAAFLIESTILLYKCNNSLPYFYEFIKTERVSKSKLVDCNIMYKMTHDDIFVCFLLFVISKKGTLCMCNLQTIWLPVVCFYIILSSNASWESDTF